MPIAATVNDKPPEEQQYTDDGWCYYLSQPDGQEFALSNPTHPKVQQYSVSSVVKGKGKGYGKSWHCGEHGHPRRGCPGWLKLQGKGDVSALKGGGKKGYKGK